MPMFKTAFNGYSVSASLSSYIRAVRVHATKTAYSDITFDPNSQVEVTWGVSSVIIIEDCCRGFFENFGAKQQYPPAFVPHVLVSGDLSSPSGTKVFLKFWTNLYKEHTTYIRTLDYACAQLFFPTRYAFKLWNREEFHLKISGSASFADSSHNPKKGLQECSPNSLELKETGLHMEWTS